MASFSDGARWRYGLGNLHLTIAKAYVVKLLGNAQVVRRMAQHKPEYLSEFQSIAELKSLPAKPPLDPGE